jgi:hypothetical protein
MTDDERIAEIERLERLRDASRQMGPGYKDRIAAIDAELEKLREG